MDDVIFKLQSDLPEGELERILERVKSLPGVAIVAPVRARPTRSPAARLCFARLDEHADAASIAELIQAMPRILYAEVPPRRGAA